MKMTNCRECRECSFHDDDRDGDHSIYCSYHGDNIYGSSMIYSDCNNFVPKKEEKGGSVEIKKTAKHVVPNQLVSEVADSSLSGANTGVVEMDMDIVENLITSKAIFWITQSFHIILENKIENSEKFDVPIPSEGLSIIMNFDRNTIRELDFIIERDDFFAQGSDVPYRMYRVVNPTPKMIEKWLNLSETVTKYIKSGFCVWIHEATT